MAKPRKKPETQQVVPAPDYRHLPEAVALEDTVATHETDPAPDPTAGRDSDRDFMLRYAAL